MAGYFQSLSFLMIIAYVSHKLWTKIAMNKLFFIKLWTDLPMKYACEKDFTIEGLHKFYFIFLLIHKHRVTSI